MRILGIDPALTKLGYGIIEIKDNRINYVHSGLITTTPKETMPQRLAKISEDLSNIITVWQPAALAMEETFVNKNPTTSLKLAMVRGVIMALAGGLGFELYEFKPNAIKKALVGSGHAEKEQIKRMAELLITGVQKLNSFDEADALAVAYTYHVHNPVAINIISKT